MNVKSDVKMSCAAPSVQGFQAYLEADLINFMTNCSYALNTQYASFHAPRAIQLYAMLKACIMIALLPELAHAAAVLNAQVTDPSIC